MSALAVIAPLQTLAHSLACILRPASIAACESPETYRSGLLKARLFLSAFFCATFVQPVAGGQIENRGK
jgi:hypothetical protein